MVTCHFLFRYVGDRGPTFVVYIRSWEKWKTFNRLPFRRSQILTKLSIPAEMICSGVSPKATDCKYKIMWIFFTSFSLAKHSPWLGRSSWGWHWGFFSCNPKSWPSSRQRHWPPEVALLLIGQGWLSWQTQCVPWTSWFSGTSPCQTSPLFCLWRLSPACCHRGWIEGQQWLHCEMGCRCGSCHTHRTPSTGLKSQQISKSLLIFHRITEIGLHICRSNPAEARNWPSGWNFAV